MRDFGAVLALALAFFAGPTRADDVAFSHVTVVDVVEGRLLRDRVVRISGDRIVAVTPAAGARIPKGTRVVNAKGKFLIPGLWDMHTHLLGGVPPGCPEVTFPLTVAYGVTGVREVGSYLDYVYVWREEVESGRMVGPRIVGTDRLIDGEPPVHPGIATVARTPGDARLMVDIMSRRGAEFVKAYENLSRDASTVFFIIASTSTFTTGVYNILPIYETAAAYAADGRRWEQVKAFSGMDGLIMSGPSHE